MIIYESSLVSNNFFIVKYDVKSFSIVFLCFGFFVIDNKDCSSFILILTVVLLILFTPSPISYYFPFLLA